MADPYRWTTKLCRAGLSVVASSRRRAPLYEDCIRQLQDPSLLARHASSRCMMVAVELGLSPK